MYNVSDNRDHRRMNAQGAAVRVRLPSQERWLEGELRDLSATGFSMHFTPIHLFGEGMQLDVIIEPGLPLTPPLQAVAEVVRLALGETPQHIACRFISFVENQ